jgi:NAD+ kinase
LEKPLKFGRIQLAAFAWLRNEECVETQDAEQRPNSATPTDWALRDKIPVDRHKEIKKVGITSKPGKSEVSHIVPPLAEWLGKRRIEVLIDRETASNLAALDSGLTRSEIASMADLVVVLGGDGTLLSTARSMDCYRIPILAVNLGGLGFLTVTTLDELYSTLELVLAGKCRMECRRRVEAELLRDGKIAAKSLALNDVVLNKGAIARLLDFDVWVDGEFVAKYKADGLIISTPTGSTAYSLAANGPVIVPAVPAFIITPICAHTLTNRPLVVPDSAVIDVATKTIHESAYLTVDGQEALQLISNDRTRVKRSDTFIELVQPPGKTYYDVLRQKLKWGER